MSSELDKIQELLSGVSSNNLLYNKYQRDDFEVGADNLNPVREIDQSLNSRLEDLKVEVYAAYKARVDSLLDAVNKDSTELSSASELGIPYKDKTKISASVKMQESAANVGEPPSLEEDLIALMGAIEPLLGGEALSNDGLPFDFCGNRGGILFGTASSINSSSSNSSGANSTQGSGSSSAAGSGTGSTTSGAATTPTNAQGLNNQGVDNGTAAAECLQLELQLLAILFAILTIIKILMAVESYVMAILMPVMQILTLVAQCWINPAAVGEAIQRFASMGVAFAMDAILSIIQMIIDSLNLDCLVNASMSAMSSMMGSINGVKDAGSDMRSFVDLSNPESSLVLREIAATWAMSTEAASTSPEESAERYKKALSQIGPDVADSIDIESVESAGKGAVASGACITKSAESVVKDYFGDGYETN